MAAGALGKDLQNEQRAIIDGQFQASLQIPLLRRTQRLVEQHLLRAMHLRQSADLIGFAATHEQRRIRRLSLARQPRDRIQACSLGQ